MNELPLVVACLFSSFVVLSNDWMNKEREKENERQSLFSLMIRYVYNKPMIFHTI